MTNWDSSSNLHEDIQSAKHAIEQETGGLHLKYKAGSTYTWMSFRDPLKNLCLGVCIVKATSPQDAIQQSHEKNINPGGEIMFFKLNEEEFESEGLTLNKLYTREEMLKNGFKFVGHSKEAHD